MNVLYLINFAGKAGTEKYVLNLVNILGKTEIKAHLAYNIAGNLSETLVADGVPCVKIDMEKKSIFSAAKKLAEYCRENEIDVIHAQYPRENIIALLSKRHYNVPKVIMTNHLTLKLSGASGIVWRGLNRHFTPKNHRIIAVCNEGRDIMLQNGVSADKIAVIFNGIEPAGKQEKLIEKRKDLELPNNCFVMTIFARLAPEKGLSFLLDALAKLKTQTDKPFCCLICGDGELYSTIKAKKFELELENNCKLLGFRKDTKEILLCSDAYICSSSHNEAMSFAILEAMNCGLPLVVTDVGGNRDLAETFLPCGYVLPYGDVDGFAEKLLLLMNDPDLCENLSASATAKIEKHFNLYDLAFDILKIYKA